MSINKVVVREFKGKDYKDLIETGYDLADLRELRSIHKYKGVRSKFIDTLAREQGKIFVAYLADERKTVGKITLRKISNSLWGLWSLFVSPKYRRRGIGSLLYGTSFKHLQDNGIKKAIGTVATENIPSIKAIEKNWDGFLSQRFYYYSGTVPFVEKKRLNDIVIRNYRPNDRENLFEVYKACCYADWHAFLEIDKRNFLDRFIDHISGTGMVRLLFKKKVCVAEERGKVKGYMVIVGSLFRHVRSALYLFLPPGDSYEVGKSLISKAFHDSLVNRVTHINLLSVTDRDEILLDRILPGIRSKRQIQLVTIRKLR